MKLTENTLRELIRKELISLEEGITEAKSNLKTLLGTSEDESIGRKIRLGGKRDPGQEVWQKVDGKFWMNLKTKKKLDLNKWAKHADGFHMSDKDLQFESKVNEATSLDKKFVKKWEQDCTFLQGKMEEFKSKIDKNEMEHGMANGAYYHLASVKDIPGQWVGHELNEDKVNESKIDVALNKMDKWLPEDPEAMERYYEILNQESWKDMKEFFIEYGNEDVLQSYGLQMKDMTKLAKAAMDEGIVNEAADFKLRWLKDTPELADILRKDILKLWKKHKLDDKKQNRPEGGKWGASYTFRKGHNKKNYIDTTELQWNRAEGPRRTAEDDENGGYEHILKFVRDVREVLSNNGYESKFLPTGGPYRHDHLAIWHNKDVEKSGNGFAANESVTEGAPKMAKNKEAENIQELMNQIANAQKGGGSGRYGKEFEKAKTKALRAIKDMVTYAKIGR